VERFTRVDARTLTDELTVDDPNVFERPWTVSLPFVKSDDYQVFEYACHEGNKATRGRSNERQRRRRRRKP
jgi:hypothetical protein